MLIDYLHIYPNVVVWYRKSGMISYINSDAEYLVLPKSQSRIAGDFSLGATTLCLHLQYQIHILQMELSKQFANVFVMWYHLLQKQKQDPLSITVKRQLELFAPLKH